MIRHLLKLVWNRKRSNGLLLLEILFSFLVVCVVTTLGLFTASMYRRPLGFSWRDVWSVAIDVKQVGDDSWTPEQRERLERILRETTSMPEIEAAALTMEAPFGFEASNHGWTRQGRRITSEVVEATEDYDKVMGVKVVAGRWFDRSDAAQPWRSVVISRSLARQQFGGEDPLGKPLHEVSEGRDEQRVVGVIEDFRRGGDLALPGNVYIQLSRQGNNDDRPGRRLLVKVRPGTPVAFEETLVRRLGAMAPDWSFEAQSLARLRDAAFRFRIVPVVVGALVSFFLLAMVALGLLGVLWQNLLRRTREIGVRRALGASARAVQGQVLLEQALLALLAIALGLVLVLQLPLFGLVGVIGLPIYCGGVALAALAILVLTALCSLYPSWLARRVQPAEALRYE